MVSEKEEKLSDFDNVYSSRIQASILRAPGRRLCPQGAPVPPAVPGRRQRPGPSPPAPASQGRGLPQSPRTGVLGPPPMGSQPRVSPETAAASWGPAPAHGAHAFCPRSLAVLLLLVFCICFLVACVLYLHITRVQVRARMSRSCAHLDGRARGLGPASRRTGVAEEASGLAPGLLPLGSVAPAA